MLNRSFVHLFFNLLDFKILSIAFEFAEYSLQHQLPNFAEVRLTRDCETYAYVGSSAGGTM